MIILTRLSLARLGCLRTDLFGARHGVDRATADQAERVSGLVTGSLRWANISSPATPLPVFPFAWQCVLRQSFLFTLSPFRSTDLFREQVLPQLQHARGWREDLAGGRPHAPVRLRRGSELSAAVRPWRCGRDYLGPARGRFSSRAAVSGVRACRERILGLHATLDGSTDRELQPKAARVPHGRVLGARQVFPFQ